MLWIGDCCKHLSAVVSRAPSWMYRVSCSGLPEGLLKPFHTAARITIVFVQVLIRLAMSHVDIAQPLCHLPIHRISNNWLEQTACTNCGGYFGTLDLLILVAFLFCGPARGPSHKATVSGPIFSQVVQTLDVPVQDEVASLACVPSCLPMNVGCRATLWLQLGFVEL